MSRKVEFEIVLHNVGSGRERASLPLILEVEGSMTVAELFGRAKKQAREICEGKGEELAGLTIKNIS